MEKYRNYFSEVGKYIRDNDISYHNIIDVVEKYFIDNNFNNNEKSLLAHHIESQIDLELSSSIIISSNNNKSDRKVSFDPTFDYHKHSLSLLKEEDTTIHNISDKVKKVFIDNNFSHNQCLFYRYVLLFHFNMKIFEANLKSSIK